MELFLRNLLWRLSRHRSLLSLESVVAQPSVVAQTPAGAASIVPDACSVFTPADAARLLSPAVGTGLDGGEGGCQYTNPTSQASAELIIDPASKWKDWSSFLALYDGSPDQLPTPSGLGSEALSVYQIDPTADSSSAYWRQDGLQFDFGVENPGGADVRTQVVAVAVLIAARLP